MPDGYCTVADLRRVLNETELPGEIQQDRQLARDAITAQTEWFEKTYKRHWYVSGGLDEDPDELIPTGPKTRDDEHDLPTHGGFVHGVTERDRHRHSHNTDSLLEAGPRHEHRRRHFREPKQAIRIATGDPNALEPPITDSAPAYTRIRLARRDVQAINTLNVITADGSYVDWVADSGFTGGVGTSFRGDDYWIRINNDGVAELYLDVHALDDDLASLSNAVYVDLDYGHEGLPQTARRGIAYKAAAHFAEEATIQIPENATVYNVETLAERFESKAAEKLSSYRFADMDDDDTE